MTARLAELVAIGVCATIVTVLIAAPVLRRPSERLFGAESVGRHHDPFTAMERFGRPGGANLYTQPLTDTAGAWLTRLAGPVAAFNVLVLVSFPLSAMAAYLLARHLGLATWGATVAALAFAFSPFHLAQAAYHPHIAQTQWVPLYLLALWRCLDTASASALVLLVVATLAVVLSNFYAGLIMAVATPAAVGAYWFVKCRRDPHAGRRLLLTVGSLLGLAAAGIAFVAYAAPEVLAMPTAFAFPRADLFLYSATWWSYLVPPVAHPIAGPTVADFWHRSGVDVGLLEQQVSLGTGIVILGVVALIAWWRRRSPSTLWPVPVLASVALVAFVSSLSPERTIWGLEIVRPAA